MSTLKTTRPPLSTWQVQMLRLTAFPSPSAQIQEVKWWDSIIGESPETRNLQPRTGEQLETGKYNDGQLLLNIHPLRIDWRYSAVDNVSPDSGKIPTIGQLVESLNAFRELMHQWLALESSPSLIRLAFGAILFQPVETPLEGYKLIGQYLPFDWNIEGASDFLYQINRPRNSNSSNSELKINRLSKWSLAGFQNMMVSIVPGQITTLPVQFQAYGAHLELDINTAQDFEGELPREILPNLFDELTELGKEIAQKGDVA